MIMIGASAGLILRSVGFDRSVAGRSTRAALIAAWTSRAAPSMSRPRLNCSVIRAEPIADCEVISLTSAIVPSRRSSGVATLDAIVVGLRAGEAGLDRDRREIDLRQRRHRQDEEGGDPRQRDADGQQDRARSAGG